MTDGVQVRGTTEVIYGTPEKPVGNRGATTQNRLSVCENRGGRWCFTPRFSRHRLRRCPPSRSGDATGRAAVERRRRAQLGDRGNSMHTTRDGGRTDSVREASGTSDRVVTGGHGWSHPPLTTTSAVERLRRRRTGGGTGWSRWSRETTNPSHTIQVSRPRSSFCIVAEGLPISLDHRDHRVLPSDNSLLTASACGPVVKGGSDQGVTTRDQAGVAA